MIDLDNTLSDRDTAVSNWANEWFEDRALGEHAKQWFFTADNDGYSARAEVFGGLRKQFDMTDSVDDLLAAYRAGVLKHVVECDGATQCLAELRQSGHTVAIVSNGSSLAQHRKIDALGFRERVDAVIVSEDLAIKKPDRRIFEAAAAASGASLADAWMVGDAALHDVAGAQALGLRTAWLRRGRPWPSDTQPPTVMLDDLNGLVAAIHERI